MRNSRKILMLILTACISIVYSQNTTSSIISQDSIKLKVDSFLPFKTEITKINYSGMSDADYRQMEQISWNPITKDSIAYLSSDIDLNRYTLYPEMEKLINGFTRSACCRAYSASLTSTDGRKMYALEIGSGTDAIVFTAGVHAREVANPQFILKYACSLINGFEKSDSAIVQLLQKVKIIILPCVNPDGYSVTIEGKKAIHNRQLFYSSYRDKDLFQWKSNGDGVDLNHSFPNYSAGICWKGIKSTWMISDKPGNWNYAGPRLGTENETKVAMSFLLKYIPVASVFADLHSAGRSIYAGKPHLSELFNLRSQLLGSEIKNLLGYKLYTVQDEVTGLGTDGSITDFASEVAAGFTFNPALGRYSPPNGNELLIRKYNHQAHPKGIVTIESLLTRYGGLQYKSTIEMQRNEWKEYNFPNLYRKMTEFATRRF